MAKAKEKELTLEEKQQKAIQLALDVIRKEHGNDAILTQNDVVPGVEFFSSGCLSLNKALGGGYARGRFIEIVGPESSGKTTLALHAIAQIQQAGGVAGFIDAEHALDPGYAEALGVDMSKLLVSQPESGEVALDIVETLVRTGAVQLLVVDSVAALTPKKEIEGQMGDSNMGLHARLMSQAMRKLAAACHRANCTVLFINQIRMKIGVMFGNPETTTGGNALKFYASQRIDVRRIGGIKPPGSEDDATIKFVANRTRAKVTKNKVAPPFREVEFDIVYGQGINAEADLLDVAVDAKIVAKSGAWYAYEGKNVAQGRDKACIWLKENPSIAEEIRGKL